MSDEQQNLYKNKKVDTKKKFDKADCAHYSKIKSNQNSKLK